MSEAMAPGGGRLLILLGGGPAAGKSALARRLVAATPDAVLLDKDTLSGPWVDRMLERAGVDSGTREGPVYLEAARPIEYRTLVDVALENLACARHAVCVAPFLLEFRDPEWLDARRAEAREHEARVMTIWIETAPDVAHARLVKRAEARDRWKMESWARTGPDLDYAPPAPVDAVVVNGAGTSLDAAADSLCTRVHRALRADLFR